MSVGDIVWYWEGMVEHAAIVTRVWNSTTLSLFVCDDGSGSFIGERAAKMSIAREGYGANRLGGCWTPRGER